MLFKFLWLFDTVLIVAVIIGFILYLFRTELSKVITGTWIGALVLLVLTMLSAAWLNSSDYSVAAAMILALLAAPGVVYLFLVLFTQVFGLKLKKA